MPSRVTQGMLNSQLLRNVSNNLRKMDNLQNQLSNGRRINKPSDDPVGISFSMRYRSELSANDQYQSNVDSAVSWLDYSDTVLDQAGSVLQRARELAVKGANGTNSQEAMNAMQIEMMELRSQLVNIGNSEFNGKHVFNGQLTDKRPYMESNAANDATDDGSIKFEIGVGVQLAVNVTGNRVFGLPSDNDNAFKVLDDLISNLGSGNYNGVSNTIGRLDSRLNSFLDIRSEIGAKTNRVELAESRLKDININLQTLQSKTEDADMALVITNMKTAENTYQASLATGARIIRASLIDFLR